MARLTLTGQEILIVDQDERVRRGLDKLLRDMGFLVTAVSDPERARDQLANKFFPVALIDLDTPSPAAGLELLRFAKERAPVTEVIMLSVERSFDAAALGFRAGATDVVPKTQDAVPYLRDRVAVLCREINAKINKERVIVSVADAHESFLTELMELSRRMVDLEDRLLSREGGSSPSIAAMIHVGLLIVDDEASLTAAIEPLLPSVNGWRLRRAQSGGEALDAASQGGLHIVVVKEHLPDLPSSMVVNTIRSTNADAVVLQFTPPRSDSVGEVKMVEQSRLITLIPSFTEAPQLARSLEEIREGIKQKNRERRYLNVFRRDHLEFLKRYNRLKNDMEAAGFRKRDG